MSLSHTLHLSFSLSFSSSHIFSVSLTLHLCLLLPPSSHHPLIYFSISSSMPLSPSHSLRLSNLCFLFFCPPHSSSLCFFLTVSHLTVSFFPSFFLSLSLSPSIHLYLSPLLRVLHCPSFFLYLFHNFHHSLSPPTLSLPLPSLFLRTVTHRSPNWHSALTLVQMSSEADVIKLFRRF